MSSRQLLELDFFNEWSVHIDYSATSRPNIIQFMIKDDVISRQEHHRPDKVVQFNFNILTDHTESVVKEMVSATTLQRNKTGSSKTYHMPWYRIDQKPPCMRFMHYCTNLYIDLYTDYTFPIGCLCEWTAIPQVRLPWSLNYCPLPFLMLVIYSVCSDYGFVDF